MKITNKKEKKYLFKRKGMTSYLFNGQWSTDKNERKYRHMSIIPYPVCLNAAIYYEGRRLMNKLLRRKTTRK